MTDHHDVIAAFVDSEPVGAQDLAAALSAPAGRDYLIDLLVLRGMVGGALVAGARPVHAGGAGPAGRPRPRGLWLTAAAALIVMGLVGFMAGRVMTDRASSVDLRPASDVATTDATTSAPAPAPTHVIRMEKGVDWNERSGGN